MTLIGSARIDENGHATGGKAGDQKQIAIPDMKGEVAQQNFYVPSKGWHILRAKNSLTAMRIAMAMIMACNNPNIGYNQARRLDIIKYGTAADVKISCDCSSLVRQCVIEAGVNVGNFTTANEAKMLVATGMFDKYDYVRNAILFTGDILVTKIKGHTAVVTDGLNRDASGSVAVPTIKKGAKGDNPRLLQHNLNQCGYDLEEDGDFGRLSTAALIKWQKANGLEPDGIYGKLSYAKMKEVLHG